MYKFKYFDEEYSDIEIEQIVSNLRNETRESARKDAVYLYSLEREEEDKNITEQ